MLRAHNNKQGEKPVSIWSSSITSINLVSPHQTATTKMMTAERKVTKIAFVFSWKGRKSVQRESMAQVRDFLFMKICIVFVVGVVSSVISFDIFSLRFSRSDEIHVIVVVCVFGVEMATNKWMKGTNALNVCQQRQSHTESWREKNDEEKRNKRITFIPMDQNELHIHHFHCAQH